MYSIFRVLAASSPVLDISLLPTTMATLKVHGGGAFLNWRATTPRLYITAESDEFDDLTLQAWRDEGFDVQYLPFGAGGKGYVKTLHSLKDNLGVGGTFAIVGTCHAPNTTLKFSNRAANEDPRQHLEMPPPSASRPSSART